MSIFDHGFKRWRARATSPRPTTRPPIVAPSREPTATRGVGDTIYDLPEARLHVVSKNEIAFDEKQGSDDPVKLRFGAWPGTGTRYLGAITFDILSGNPGNPHRAEKGILAFNRGEFGTGDGGEVELHLQRPHTDDDANMIHVATFYSDRVELLSLGAGGPLPTPPVTPPVVGPPVIPPVPPTTGFVYQPVVTGVRYSFRAGSWADIGRVFPFPVDEDVVQAYAAHPTDAGWIALVDRMFIRRDD